MGAYNYIQKTLREQYKQRDGRYKKKVTSWRNGPVIERLEKPTNITRARMLGYKAKQGYSVVRVRIEKGRRRRRRPRGGRKPKSNYRIVQPGQSHQAIAEQRVNRRYRNMEVLNSYWIGEDGKYKFFEVILADPAKPTVNISSSIRQGKTFRGLTSVGKKGRPTKRPDVNKKVRKRRKIGKLPKKYIPITKKEKKTVVRKKGIKAKKVVKKASKKSEKKKTK